MGAMEEERKTIISRLRHLYSDPLLEGTSGKEISGL
jgi:hypothetical protein